MKSSDPKTYWKIINGSNSKRHEASLRISSEMFLHFKSLAADTTEYRKEDPDADLHDNENALSKKALSEREILALQTLNPNKACGHDYIITEFLKVSAGK